MINYVYMFIIILVTGILYEKYQSYEVTQKEKEDYDLIKQFLLNDSDSLAKKEKPIIWIHIEHEENARWWQSFYSRNSRHLNQPYLHMTIKSIIRYCQEDFNICLINDDSFSTLLSEYDINVDELPKPMKSHMRHLALCKVLHKYGGILVPNSYVCLSNLKAHCDKWLENKDMFVVENRSLGITADKLTYYPDINFMGCVRGSEAMNDMCLHIGKVISNDYTDEVEFLNQLNTYCNKLCNEQRCTLVCGSYIGVKKTNGEPVTIEELMGSTYINMPKNMIGLYIPANEILKRTNYQWFARMSPEQIIESNILISKYITLSQ